MTINDFTYYAKYGNYLYIYKTPDSDDYTIQLTGLELQDENTTNTEMFSIDPQLGWGIIYAALEKIADINGQPVASKLFFQKKEYWKNESKKKAEKKNYLKDRITPYSLL
jgi:hypothetical protein